MIVLAARRVLCFICCFRANYEDGTFVRNFRGNELIDHVAQLMFIQGKQGLAPVMSPGLSADPQRVPVETDSQKQRLPVCVFPKWRASLAGNFLKGTFQKQLAADELFGRHLVSPMHLDETTDGAELTEVVSVGPSDSCSVGALYLAAARACVQLS